MNNAAKTTETVVFTWTPWVGTPANTGDRLVIEETNLGRIRGRIIAANGQVDTGRSQVRFSKSGLGLSIAERAAL